MAYSATAARAAFETREFANRLRILRSQGLDAAADKMIADQHQDELDNVEALSREQIADVIEDVGIGDYSSDASVRAALRARARALGLL